MRDKDRLYMQEPKIIRDSRGLAKVISDRNGNEFSADSRKIGGELIIDYPPLGRRIDVYVVVGFGISGEKEWRLVAEKEWIFNGVCSYTGKWVDVKK